jgi:hypothetical protein
MSEYSIFILIFSLVSADETGATGYLFKNLHVVQSIIFPEGKYPMKNKTLSVIIGVILECCCLVVIAGAVAHPIIRNRSNSTLAVFLIPLLSRPIPPKTAWPDSRRANRQKAASAIQR